MSGCRASKAGGIRKACRNAVSALLNLANIMESLCLCFIVSYSYSDISTWSVCYTTQRRIVLHHLEEDLLLALDPADIKTLVPGFNLGP